MNIKNRDYNDVINTIMCNVGNIGQNKCFMNQQIFTYNDIPEKKIFTNDKTGKIIYQEQTNENKCFIKIVLPYFDIICVHLDAYYRKYRIEQLNQINAQISRKTIIVGDFNFFNVNDFLEWHNNLLLVLLLYIVLNNISTKNMPDQNNKIMESIKNEIDDRITDIIKNPQKKNRQQLDNIILNAIPQINKKSIQKNINLYQEFVNNVKNDEEQIWLLKKAFVDTGKIGKIENINEENFKKNK